MQSNIKKIVGTADAYGIYYQRPDHWTIADHMFYRWLRRGCPVKALLPVYMAEFYSFFESKLGAYHESMLKGRRRTVSKMTITFRGTVEWGSHGGGGHPGGFTGPGSCAGSGGSFIYNNDTFQNLSGPAWGTVWNTGLHTLVRLDIYKAAALNESLVVRPPAPCHVLPDTQPSGLTSYWEPLGGNAQGVAAPASGRVDLHHTAGQHQGYSSGDTCDWFSTP